VAVGWVGIGGGGGRCAGRVGSGYAIRSYPEVSV
jgi:hypothetical protein